MLILAVDSARSTASFALMRENTLLTHDSIAQKSQAEDLVPSLISLCDKACVSLNDVDVMSVVTGPGSFAGIRIGMAAVKGLALACETPVFGASSFELAHFMHPSHTVFAQNAGRGQTYVQHMARDEAPNMIEHESTPEHAFWIGEGMIDAEILCAYTFKNAATYAHSKHWPVVSPCYVRPPDAKPAKAL